MGYRCDNEDEHRRDARHDFDYRGSYGYNREYYEHHSFDECKRAYTEEFDRARDDERRQEERREEEREQERQELRQERDRQERIMAEEQDYYYAQTQEGEYLRAMQQEAQKQQYPDDLPF